MSKSYIAFGLALRPSFSLPGMEPVEDGGLPRVSIELEAPEDLMAGWSGGLTPSPWRGRLGDGNELTIERGVRGDLLFGYGNRARFRLDPGAAKLACAPREPGALDWRRVLLTRVLPNVSLARGREALHAGAVETPLGMVAVAAPSGTGKSTLAVELIRRGWPLVADDVLVLSRGPGGVEAHPSSPHMNLGDATADSVSASELGETLGVLGGERWVAVEAASREARPLAAVFLLERSRGLSLEAEALPASPLVLAPFMLGLPDEKGRDASRFALYSDLIESTTLLRLGADPGDRPADLADAVELSLGLRRSLPIRGAA
jgi:hypothetical protein